MLVLYQPISSPMMTRMLGFLACACVCAIEPISNSAQPPIAENLSLCGIAMRCSLTEVTGILLLAGIGWLALEAPSRLEISSFWLELNNSALLQLTPKLRLINASLLFSLSRLFLLRNVI